MVIDVFHMKRMSFPPLPGINGPQDIYLDVVTHRSLGRPTEASDYGDTDRLKLLGEHAMGMVVAHYIFNRYPSLNAEGIKQKQEETLSPHNYRTWIQHYKLRLLAAPGTSPLEDDTETVQFFNTYVGAVYHRNGLSDVTSWIWGLLEPYDPGVNMDSSNRDGSDSSTQPPSYSGLSPSPQFQQQHQSQPGSSPFYQPQQSPPGPSPFFQPRPGPSPPTEPAPPLPNGVPPSLPNGVSSLITLAVVNQTAAQRGMIITYEPGPPVGPAHSPMWTVRCMINGMERGRGHGKNQKLAKEEAAKQAWVAMGWCEYSRLKQKKKNSF